MMASYRMPIRSSISNRELKDVKGFLVVSSFELDRISNRELKANAFIFNVAKRDRFASQIEN